MFTISFLFFTNDRRSIPQRDTHATHQQFFLKDDWTNLDFRAGGSSSRTKAMHSGARGKGNDRARKKEKRMSSIRRRGRGEMAEVAYGWP
jgi:hypothetical protein